MNKQTCVNTQTVLLILGGVLLVCYLARKDLKGLVNTDTQCR
jgi:hypothetical protein